MSEEMNRYTRLNSGQYINTWSTFLNGHQANIIRLANEESEDEALNELMDGIEENHDIRYHPVWVMGGATEAQSDDPDSPPCSCEGCQPDLCSCDDCQFEGQPTHLQSDDFFGLDSPQPMMFELSPGSSPSPSPCHCDHCQLEDEWQLTLMRLTRESTGNTAHQLESFERIQMAHTPLRHAAWTASHFLDSYRGDEAAGLEAAPAIWGELQSRLSILHADECPTPNDTPAREVSCCVCLENLPNIILLPCRHTTCSRCANKLKKICPQCREGICGFKKFFL